MSAPDADRPVGVSLHGALRAAVALVAVALAVMPAVIYVAKSRTEVTTALRVKAQVLAGTIGEIAAANPSHWTFATQRIEDELERFDPQDREHTRRVFDAEGIEIVGRGGPLAWPKVVVTQPIVASGMPAGTIVIEESLSSVLRFASLIAIVSILVVGTAYRVFRGVPGQMLDSALQRVTHLATHDGLTDLPNRRLFMDRLEHAIAGLGREADAQVALLCLDLDRFKEVNDTLGHAKGDALLRQVAARLRQELRATDTLARLGGDEFAIIQPRIGHVHSAEVLARRLIEVVEQPLDLDGHRVAVGVSIGIALARGRSHGGAETLLADADTALYAAKREGRGTFRFFAEEMNVALRERRAMEADLRTALERGEFELYYQPQVNLDTSALTGVEALLRWHHPVRGFVTPDNFIPLAEEIGLLPQIGAWVLREACTSAMRWPDVNIAVNVSAHQIHAGGFETLVARALAATGLPAARLEIEITEGVLLTQTDATIGTLEQIRALGVSIAMDDFGTGYSSLGYLQRFRFDKLKIDRSFIASLATDPSAAAIVDAVLGITRALGVRANAEGVETAEQARMLSERGCTEAQGWLFGRPVPAAQIDTLVADRAALAAE